MAWTAPMTAVANSAFTAAQFNTYVRDNLNCTAPALATAAGQLIVSDGVNSIAARTPQYASVSTSQTTTSGSYADLATAGPTVTVTTGTFALAFMQCKTVCTSSAFMSVAVSGASTVAADDLFAFCADNDGTGTSQATAFQWFTTLTPGNNTFKAVYRTDSAATGTFSLRKLLVIPF